MSTTGSAEGSRKSLSCEQFAFVERLMGHCIARETQDAEIAWDYSPASPRRRNGCGWHRPACPRDNGWAIWREQCQRLDGTVRVQLKIRYRSRSQSDLDPQWVERGSNGAVAALSLWVPGIRVFLARPGENIAGAPSIPGGRIMECDKSSGGRWWRPEQFLGCTIVWLETTGSLSGVPKRLRESLENRLPTSTFIASGIAFRSEDIALKILNATG